MIGLSHVSFLGVVLALVLNLSPLYASIPIVIIAALLIQKLSDKSNIKGDSAIAIISASAMAVALFITSIKSGWNVDVNSYLFGSILTINKEALTFSLILLFIVITFILVLYKKLFTLTYDKDFAEVLGVNVKLYNTMLLVLVSIVIVLGMKILGTLLISSFIIFPALSSIKISRSFKQMIILSILVSIISVIIGVILSSIINVPTGATIVIINLIIYLTFSIIGTIKKRL